MRMNYRQLTDQQADDMQAMKAAGKMFYDLIEDIWERGAGNPRELALAKTKIEESVMWGTKAITSP